MRLPVVMVAMLVAGCAATPAELAQQRSAVAAQHARVERELAGLTPEAPTTCLDLGLVRDRSSEIYGNTLLYRLSSGLVYRNDTTGGCETAGTSRDDVVVTRTPSTQLCRGDIVETFDRVTHIPTGSCSLGDFVLYRRKKS